MRDAALDLLEAVRGALVSDPDVSVLVGTRVASSWGTTMAAPYIRIRVAASEPFRADSAVTSEIGAISTITVHAFTKEQAPVQLSALANAIREALEDRDDLVLDEADLWTLEYRDTKYLRDMDDPGLQMAVLTFAAVTTA